MESIVTYNFKDTNDNLVTAEADKDDYFKTVDELKYFLKFQEIPFGAEQPYENENEEDEFYLNIDKAGNVKHFVNMIENAIENNKIPYFIQKTLGDKTGAIKRLIKNLGVMDNYRKEKYIPLYEEMVTIQKENINKNWSLLKENWNNIKEFLLEGGTDKSEKDEKVSILKKNKKEVNKKYYENKKKQLNIPDRQPLTEEEKKERRKLANKAYREKMKQTNTTEEQEEEDASDKKKGYNKKYYQKQKDLKQKIKELEEQVKMLEGKN